MKNIHKHYFTFLIFAFFLYNNYALSQVCNVKAKMFPGADSIVAPYPNDLIVFINQSENAQSHKFIIDTWNQYTDDTLYFRFPTGLHKVQIVAYNNNCTDTATVFIFNAGTQPPNRDGFKAFYGLPNVPQFANSIAVLKDGSYLLNGYTDRSDIAYPDHGLLIKVKPSGCIEWSRKHQQIGISFKRSKVTPLNDGGMLVITGDQYDQYLSSYFLRMSSDGSYLWSKTFSQDSKPFYIIKAHETSNGDLLFCGRVNGDEAIYFLKTDKNGNILWQTRVNKNSFIYFSLCDFIEKDGYAYIGGNINSPATATGYDAETVLMKLDLTSGKVVWTKKYDNVINIESGIFQNNDLLLAAPVEGNFSQTRLTTILRLDTSGNIKQALQYLDYSRAGGSSKLLKKSDGGFYIFKYGSFPLTLQPYISYESIFVNIKSDGTPRWANTYGGAGQSYYSDAAVGKNDELVLLGDHFGFGISSSEFSWKYMFQKIDEPGTVSCNFWGDDVTTVPVTVQTGITFYNKNQTINLSTADFNINFNDGYSENRYVCPEEFLDSCSVIKLDGKRSTCNFNDTLTYRIFRNTKCIQPVEWITPPNAIIISKNNIELKIKFTGYNNYKIFAKLPYSCIPVIDSINISVFPKTAVILDLGKDTTLCPGNSLQLKADKRFLNYYWSNGTTDSLLTINAPGTYWVSVTDSCFNIFNDTILVTAAPPVPLSIGPDRTKCNTDTLRLQAPSGFINYSWGPNYNINSTTTQNTIVNPLKDTSYYVKAEKTPGCFGFDTINIKVHFSPVINLGNDTSFCNGDSIILNSGSGFSNYQWSNGNSTQKINIKSKGVYSVKSTTIQGCISTDTIKVINVFTNPVVQLNKDTGLCIGTTKTLDAGNFNSYLWNNGSRSKNISINNIGLYTVMVTDMNGCKGSDSSRITVLYPVPTLFLPADTAVCSYGKLDLKSTSSFQTYLWNNNQSTLLITINKPGLYWLQVKDRNNCYGTDSILVAQKQCMTGFFMPTAFTPDGNQLNDEIKPFIFGNVLKYDFVIYNRWGQIVFQSNDLLKGWDGKFKGIQQDPGTYLWLCRYQLEGEQLLLQKGTIILIR